MTEYRQKLELVSEALSFHMMELVHLANALESIGREDAGDSLRSIAADIETFNRTLLHRKPRHRKGKHENAEENN